MTTTKHSLFGASKAAADLLVQEYGRYFGMPTVSFRSGCLDVVPFDSFAPLTISPCFRRFLLGALCTRMARRMKEGEVLLDPLDGSGTTMVEGALLGLKTIGYDISPLCILISIVKANAKKTWKGLW